MPGLLVKLEAVVGEEHMLERPVNPLVVGEVTVMEVGAMKMESAVIAEGLALYRLA